VDAVCDAGATWAIFAPTSTSKRCDSARGKMIKSLDEFVASTACAVRLAQING